MSTGWMWKKRDCLEELCKGCTGQTLLVLEMIQSSWNQLYVQPGFLTGQKFIKG